jgi:hypothetical protein
VRVKPHERAHLPTEGQLYLNALYASSKFAVVVMGSSEISTSIGAAHYDQELMVVPLNESLHSDDAGAS